MGANWRSFCRTQRIQVDGDDVTVEFENGRRHRVRIHETDETFEMHAIVVRAAAVQAVADVPLRIWRRNRASQLVGFRRDTKGRVYAEGWVAKAGLTADEFLFVLHRVAAESDRFEFLLTGKDAE